MFRTIFLSSCTLAAALGAAPVALAQDRCLGCGNRERAEPTPEEWLIRPAERPSAKGDNNGNGRGGGNRGGGGGNGGAIDGGVDDGGTDDGGADDGSGGGEAVPVLEGCGNGAGGGAGNGTKGSGNGQACGDGSGNNGGGNGNGGGGGAGGGDGTAPSLTVQNDINFGRLIRLGNGASSVLLDIDSGQKIVAGNLDDYGGVTMVGRALVSGIPNSEVQISFPDRITMRDPRGGLAELREFSTDLPAMPRLDNTGTLEFAFTGRLTMTDTIGDGGDLRGRVPITVEYN